MHCKDLEKCFKYWALSRVLSSQFQYLNLTDWFGNHRVAVVENGFIEGSSVLQEQIKHYYSKTVNK